MHTHRLHSTVIVGCGLFALATPVSAQMGMGAMGGGGGMGGQGGGDSALRLCAVFNDAQPDPSISSDTFGQYCDGTDGEILTNEVLKLSTTTRNTADRTVRVYFQSDYCTTTLTDPGPVIDPLEVNENLDAFFGWQATEFVAPASCAPDDPFGGGLFNPNSLECLGPNASGDRLSVRDLKESDGTRYSAWRVHLTHPTIKLKKGGTALLMVFGGAFGSNQCPADDGGLPMAVQCTGEDSNGICESWHVKTFRACVFDYRDNNWNAAYEGCPVNTDITFTVKP